MSSYTCVLDVDLWVKGGGYMGQPGACVPAIAKAVSKFDPSLREHFEKMKMIRSDGRMRERKHIGRKRARKGRVYRRR